MTLPCPLVAPSSHLKLINGILGQLYTRKSFSLKNSGKYKAHYMSFDVLVPGLVWTTCGWVLRHCPPDQLLDPVGELS